MTRAPLLIVFLALPPGALAAQSAAAASAPGVQSQLARSAVPTIGRLFYTPAERAQLDIARRAKPRPQAPQAEAPPAPPPPQVVSYGGIVRRSDGKAMLWINNRLVEEKEALAGLNLKGKVGPDGAVTLQVPETGGSLEIKVGQSVEVHTGKVAETRRQREAAARDAAKAAQADGTTGTPGGAPTAETGANAGVQQPPPSPGAAPDAARASSAEGSALARPREDPRGAGR